MQEAKGDYIIFFDSDDLMTPNHLEVKYNAMVQSGCDYVISRTKYLNKDSSQIDLYYNFDKFEITPYNYVSQKINWLTYDICIMSSLAKKISFNEALKSGQEYNYFSKLVHYSVKAQFVDKVVTLRRYHDGSVRSQLKTKHQLNESYVYAAWYTFLDIEKISKGATSSLLLKRITNLIMENRNYFGISKIHLKIKLYKYYGLNTVYSELYLISKSLFNRGYFFRKSFFDAIL